MQVAIIVMAYAYQGGIGLKANIGAPVQALPSR